jgi:hypothetical protein
MLSGGLIDDFLGTFSGKTFPYNQQPSEAGSAIPVC